MKTTIITPCYNSEKYISRTIDSILENGPTEYTIVDGKSTDNTFPIIESYHKQIDIISELDTGQSQAINKGLRNSRGDIINWINSDDILQPNSLNTINKYFEKNPEIGFLHGKTILFGIGKSKVVAGNPEESPNKYLSGMSFPQPSAFFHRKVLDKVGLLDESLHYGFDYDFYVRIAMNFPVLEVKDVFSKYRLHPTSKTVTSHLGFANDWNKVFNRVLRSLKYPRYLISDLKSLNLIDSEEVYYKVTRRFSVEELEESVLYFLYYQLYYRSLSGCYKECLKILEYLRKKYPGFYKMHRFYKTELKINLLTTLKID